MDAPDRIMLIGLALVFLLIVAGVVLALALG